MDKNTFSETCLQNGLLVGVVDAFNLDIRRAFWFPGSIFMIECENGHNPSVYLDDGDTTKYILSVKDQNHLVKVINALKVLENKE